MSCGSCSSASQAEVTTEMMLQVRSLDHVVDPGVLAVVKVHVCLDCGFSQFKVPELELQLLRKSHSRAA